MMNLGNMHFLNKVKKAQLLLGFFILTGLFSCKSGTNEIYITDFTMGTTYSIRIINDTGKKVNSMVLKTQIDSVLISINQQMSTYINDSEISIFNSGNNNDWQYISQEFHEVIRFSQNISKLTNGAFDITVSPLVNIWGFGTFNQIDWKLPNKKEIENILNKVGYQNIEIKTDSIRKINSATTIDLNAIAKGFGVDAVFDFLTDKGFNRLLVEVGGEVRCSGNNKYGTTWTVGIDQPIFDAVPGSNLEDIIELENGALATSGDYRNYFYYRDKIYSHTIDPRTGFPIEGGIASASVIAPTCMMADALATALMVMGMEGINLVEQLDNVEALLIERISDGEFKTEVTSGWPIG